MKITAGATAAARPIKQVADGAYGFTEGSRMDLEAHPVTTLFPPMKAKDFSSLVADMREHGQREPIKLYGGQIIDGLHRYKACGELGIEPKTEAWVGTETELVSYVVSLNMHRRHLTASQRAMVAEKIAARGRGGDRSKAPIGALPTSDAARLLNVGTSTLDRARVVREQGTPELIEAVEKGDVTVSRASEIAKKPKEKQRIASKPKRDGRRRRPLGDKIDSAIESIDVATLILARGVGAIDGDVRRPAWAKRLREARLTMSRFIACCEKEH